MAVRLVITLLVMFVAQFAFTADLSALDSAVLSSTRNSYFKHDGLTFSEYLHLRPDGTYRQITREHLYVEERDHGRWEQNRAGDLLLKSELHYHEIIYGKLWISLWHRERYETLPDLKQRIQQFILDNRSAEFPAKAIEAIRESLIPGQDKIKLGDIAVFGSQSVNRKDLEGLLAAIDHFVGSDDKNVFSFKPLKYKSAVIFVEESRVPLTQKIIADELVRPRHHSHRADRHGYEEVNIVRFTEEIKEMQPFLFFPEMNKHRKRRAHE